MDPRRFDSLVKSLSTSSTRHKIVRLLVALPLGVALTSVLGDGSEAAGEDNNHGGSHRRQRRKAKHRHQTGKDKDNRKGKRKGKDKEKDTPKKPCTSSTCPANACGSQPDGCGGTLSCGCTGNQICVASTCRACDVCASGCRFPTVRDAIDAAPAGGTVHICPGTYLDRENSDMNIGRSLTLIGAGDGLDGTILQRPPSSPAHS